LEGTIFPPDGELRFFYGLSNSIQEGDDSAHSTTGHDESELLASIAKGLAEGNLIETGCDEPQHLVPHLVSIAVVEMLEVIHVHHRDGVVVSQSSEAFLEGSTARHFREFIQISSPPG
jgi:hypothetical protein